MWQKASGGTYYKEFHCKEVMKREKYKQRVRDETSCKSLFDRR